MKHSSSRLLLIDLAKGIAILSMVGLHYLYVLKDAQLISEAIIFSWPYIVVSRIVAITFVGLSTTVLWYRSTRVTSTSSWFRSLAKQVIKLTLAALLVSLATYWWLGESYVRFGILHLLAVATLINGMVFRLRLPQWWYGFFGVLVVLIGMRLSLAFYPIYGWEWLGLMPIRFTSVDYVPVLPWLGITWLSVLIAPSLIIKAQHMQSGFATHTSWNWLLFCGKHSLAIYLLHVPLLLGALWIISSFL
jgi:uncharacterized membrane protein